MIKNIGTVFLGTVLLLSLNAQECTDVSIGWCEAEIEVINEEGVTLDDTCYDYYYYHRCRAPYWRDDIPPRDIDADWPGRMREPLFDALTR